MKPSIILTLFLLLLVSWKSMAFTCSTGSTTIPSGGSVKPVDAWVDFSSSNLEDGVLVTIENIKCRGGVVGWTDYLKTDAMSQVLSPAIFSDNIVTLTVNGIVMNPPIPADMEIISVKYLEYQVISMQILIKFKRSPSHNIIVRKGDVIGQLNFKQSNDQAGCPLCGPYRWRLRARNEFLIATSTCNINNGQQINVSFPELNQKLLTTSANTAVYKHDQNITINCANYFGDDNIKINLVSDTSPFSTELIKSTNNNIGFALIHQGTVIKPGSSFSSSITQGHGNSSITLSPVKANVPASQIATGELSSSATLIISAE